MIHSPTHAGCQTFGFLIWKWCKDRAQELIRTDWDAARLHPEVSITGLDHLLPLAPPEPGKLRLVQIEVDPEYAMTTDLNKPIIAAPLAPEHDDSGNRSVMVIDGWHRVYRARREGREVLPIFLLSPDAEQACRIPIFI
ncbi:hypothetical protein [Saccharopolyspora phatthalungensis]|uniref:ParB/Sulfiredoxin domain-containing protein n=1 Tax=Saccharopolyspora phatthalungensis TaxID=664693 RepID=A0A840QDF1_9PSEU|nr:hypothetical protein [Saccharopolyspora phatthalungensis]MBB5154983.1 hypothetical protein [Saccharopolyspora phatthalungensis]